MSRLATRRFGVAVLTCDDFGEWRFRETLGQEDAEVVGQGMVAICRASFIRLLVSDFGDTMSPTFCFQCRVVPSSVNALMRA